MKIARRFLALLTALLMVFSLLAACGNGEGDDNTSSDALDYLEGSSSNQIALFGDLKGTKLRISGSVEMKDWEKDFFPQFEESTGMTVEIEPMSATELLTKITQAVASNDQRNYYDVAVIGNTSILQAIYGNLIVPMDQYIDREDPVWQYSYSENSAKFLAPDVFKIDGKVWGVPSHGFHETFIFYNKTYFEEMQAPDPYEEYYLKDNWTFQTFLDTCKAVTKKAADGTVEVAAWASWNYFMWPAAAGNNIIDQKNDKWQVVIDQPNGIAGLNVLYECAKNGWLDVKTSGYEEFVNRKIAMIIDKPSSAMGGPEAYSRLADEIGMVPFPKMDASQEKYICPLTASGYSIASCAQNPGGAAAYIYYHRLGEMRTDEIVPSPTLRHLNEEAQARRTEYLKKCDFGIPMIEGLQGWYSGGPRDQILKQILREHKNPSTIVDSMKGVIQDCLRKTVG